MMHFYNNPNHAHFNELEMINSLQNFQHEFWKMDLMETSHLNCLFLLGFLTENELNSLKKLN